MRYGSLEIAASAELVALDKSQNVILLAQHAVAAMRLSIILQACPGVLAVSN